MIFFLAHIDQCKTRMDGILWHNNFDCFYVFDDDETNKPTQNTTNKQKKRLKNENEWKWITWLMMSRNGNKFYNGFSFDLIQFMANGFIFTVEQLLIAKQLLLFYCVNGQPKIMIKQKKNVILWDYSGCWAEIDFLIPNFCLELMNL